MPLGGIGTGGVELGGRGNLQNWQIFNRSERDNTPGFLMPVIWAKQNGAKPYCSVLERRLFPPFDTTDNGLGDKGGPGLPRMAEAVFHSSFPVARVEFLERKCPVQVSLDAFAPFFPVDAEASGLPCAVLTYEVHNPGVAPADVSIAWSVENPIGDSKDRHNKQRSAAGWQGILMTDPSMAKDDALQGSFALAALPEGDAKAELLTAWRNNTWSSRTSHWYESFAETGELHAPDSSHGFVGSIALRQTIPAGATRRFRFLLTWYFPNRTPERCGWEAPKGYEKTLLGNYYCTRFKDAWDVAEYTTSNLPDLEGKTRSFVQAMQKATLPDVVKDGATSNLSTMVSNTLFRIADGSYHGFEGCGDLGGLGFGTCTHVWNYEVATQFVFPSVSRSMREISFGYATDETGHMDVRHRLPAGIEHGGVAAADGQMGQIVKLYIDWKLSGDTKWLAGRWPGAKRATEFAWEKGGWDGDQDGVMEGAQHNTYDVEFFGPNADCQTWYLAALKASAAMATAMNDGPFAAKCTDFAKRGSAWMDANLFNGEFYIQKIKGIPGDQIAQNLTDDDGKGNTIDPDYQLGGACHVDQLAGQYIASLAGLGTLLDPEKMESTQVSRPLQLQTQSRRSCLCDARLCHKRRGWFSHLPISVRRTAESSAALLFRGLERFGV